VPLIVSAPNENARFIVLLPTLRAVEFTDEVPTTISVELATTEPIVRFVDKTRVLAETAAALTTVLLAVNAPLTTMPLRTTKFALFEDI
jgi:hypothetical protein